MLVAIIGENCVGKTTLANKINERLNGKIFSGKDYLRLEKNALLAEERFKEILIDAQENDNIIYIITEEEHLKFLPVNSFKIVLTADLDTIKERFKMRMRGFLPTPVEKMLESKHGIYDSLECDLRVDNDYDIFAIYDLLKL